jgi:hypothetical protein
VTGEENVHLVTAHGADLSLPELTGLRMERKPVSIAMTVGENFGFRSRASNKRIVGRDGAVVSKTERFPDMVAGILRLDPKAVVVRSVAANAIAITDGKVERCIGTKENSACKVSSGLPRIGDEDLLDFFDPGAFEAATRYGNCRPALTGLRIGHIHKVVLCEAGM